MCCGGRCSLRRWKAAKKAEREAAGPGAKKTHPVICVVCGITFETSFLQYTCSKPCKKERERRMGNAKRASVRASLKMTCECCGEPIPPERKTARFCSNKCIMKSKAKPVICVACGVEFYPIGGRTNRSKTCSDECTLAKDRERESGYSMNLTSYYVAAALGMSVSIAGPELIAAKRAQIALKRAAKNGCITTPLSGGRTRRKK